MADPVKNFAKVQVSTGYDDDDTSVVLASGHGAKLPAPSTDGAFDVVWWNFTDYPDPSDDPNVEIVTVTARSTDTLTIARAKQNTSASTKNTGGKTYKMILTPTAKTIEDIVDSQEKEANTGFGAWSSGADASTYSLSGGVFTLDRPGYGYINGKKISFASGQSIGSFSANTFYWLYIDADGVLQKSSTFPAGTIRLFELLYDGTIYMVAKENHPYSFNSAASGYLHNNAGTTIRGTGAIVTRVATGTGASADDRRIKTVGADTLDDHGLSTTIAEQNPVTWNVFYRNGSGKWVRDSQVTELPIKYNNAGTPTALDAVTDVFSIYTLYVAKDDIENSAPQYIAVMGEIAETLLVDILADISSGGATFVTNELKSIEAAQLGYAVVQYSATGGHIEELQVVKSSFNQVLVGGAAGSDHGLLSGLTDQDHPASAIYTDTSNFNNHLSSADDTVQKALETLDELVAGSNFIFGEVPSGAINGSNATFVLDNTPAQLAVYLNGQRLTVTEDYTISTATITMVIAPFTGDILIVDYTY